MTLPRSPGVISKRVPPDGPLPGDYDILVIGEAPGEDEVDKGRPFIGRVGQLQERYFDAHGIYRPVIKYMNLCNYRPAGNNFENLIGTWELDEGLDEIEAELSEFMPNVITAFGNWPLWYITGNCGTEHGKKKPGTGIMTYRGSRLPALPRFGGDQQKVFASFHPSFILHNWGWNPVLYEDIKQIVFDSTFPEFRYPEYESHIDPDSDVLYTLTHEALSAPYISLDIETFVGGRFSCVGFGYVRPDGTEVGVCTTYQRQDLWRFPMEVWMSDTPKILQYATYDINFMRNFYNWRIGGYYNGLGHDTYIAAASIMPDFPRGLDFLTSIYTRFPFYKEERKTWRENNDMSQLWRYNIKDVIATQQIAYKQMGEIDGLFKG